MTANKGGQHGFEFGELNPSRGVLVEEGESLPQLLITENGLLRGCRPQGPLSVVYSTGSVQVHSLPYHVDF